MHSTCSIRPQDFIWSNQFRVPFSNGAAPNAVGKQALTRQQLQDAIHPPPYEYHHTLPIDIGNLDGCATIRHEIFRRHEDQRSLTPLYKQDVLDFFDYGHIPEGNPERAALAQFLVFQNNLEALAWLLVHTDSSEIDISDCALGNEGVKNIADWAKSVPFNIRLNLSGNHIDAEGARFLAEALKANTIEVLSLNDNPLGDDGVEHLCIALACNSSMLEMKVCSVEATDAGIRAVANVLESHATLSRLNLSGSAFDEATAGVLASALAHNRTLDSLEMAEIDASDASVSILVRALGCNKVLKSLEISRQREITETDSDDSDVEADDCDMLFALAETLTANSTLTHLSLSYGTVSEQAAEHLYTAVDRNTTLCSLSLQAEHRWPLPYQTEWEELLVARVRKNVLNPLIEAAGAGVFELALMGPEPVVIPDEIGRLLAASLSQVAPDGRSIAALQTLIDAGQLGLRNMD